MKGDVWASDFLSGDNSQSDVNVGKDWSSDFLKEHPSLNGPDNPLVKTLGPLPLYNDRWAEEYLSEDVPVLKQTAESSNHTGDLADIANQILDEAKDTDIFSESSFFKFLSDIGSGDAKLIDGNFVKKSEDSAAASLSAGGPNLTASQWADEFSADLTDTDFDRLMEDKGKSVSAASAAYKQDFWHDLEEEWKELATTKEHPWLSEFDELRQRQHPVEKYEFREENPFLQQQDGEGDAAASSLLAEGRARLAQGDIPSAVLLFEAAVQRDPTLAEGWSLLGTTQAKNEQDPSALSALAKAVALDSKDVAAWMALAVSYTNESYQAQACRSLQEWIQRQPQYAHLATNGGSSSSFRTSTSSFMSPELHGDTLDMFLGAARLASSSPTSSVVDADVQCGLGILFNLSGDFDKAVDCFRAALQVRPDDALLWNKLGATLANGNRSEEAVSAYHTALQISPGFIRCRYNLGISCINLKAYSEAAQHFLTALNFQSAASTSSSSSSSAHASSAPASGRGPQGETFRRSVMSESIWSSLRLSLSLMGGGGGGGTRREDLQADLDGRDLEKLSREFGVSQA